MRNLDISKIDRDDSKILKRAFALALIFEFTLLTLMGIQEHWLAHPQKTTGLDATKFIEAEVFQIPKESHLTEEKKISAPQPKEVAISKRVDEGKKSLTRPKIDEQNQTDSGPTMAANHSTLSSRSGYTQ